MTDVFDEGIDEVQEGMVNIDYLEKEDPNTKQNNEKDIQKDTVEYINDQVSPSLVTST